MTLEERLFQTSLLLGISYSLNWIMLSHIENSEVESEMTMHLDALEHKIDKLYYMEEK